MIGSIPSWEGSARHHLFQLLLYPAARALFLREVVETDSLLCFHLEIYQLSSWASQGLEEPGCIFGYCQSLRFTQKVRAVHGRMPSLGTEIMFAIFSLTCIPATILGCKTQVKKKTSLSTKFPQLNLKVTICGQGSEYPEVSKASTILDIPDDSFQTLFCLEPSECCPVTLLRCEESLGAGDRRRHMSVTSS